MKCLPFVALGGVVALSACGGNAPGGQAAADADTRAACRQRANEVYNQQNRGQIYSPPSTVNTPYSANFVPDAAADRRLSDLFAHDRMVSNCVRNTGTGGGSSPPTAPAAPPAH